MSGAASGANGSVAILGTRGVPAAHGGFETFAERLALYLVERDWRVTVYCQTSGIGWIRRSSWKGIRRVEVPIAAKGAKGTVLFDGVATSHACLHEPLVLVLGYNTAFLSVLFRSAGVTSVMNMDGIEWRREKWSAPERLFLRANEWLGMRLSDALVADHPEIRNYLISRGADPDRLVTIPYGSDAVLDADSTPLHALGLVPGRYALVVARPVPENSVLEIVRAFSTRRRGLPLVVLGRLDAKGVPYHRTILAAAGPEVRFLGAIYEPATVAALRSHARMYLHGHQVGGTNPSLVEALGAGNPVVAHDNRFNRWVAGPDMVYFSGSAELSGQLDALLGDPERLAAMSRSARMRFDAQFHWDPLLARYERLLAECRSRQPARARPDRPWRIPQGDVRTQGAPRQGTIPAYLARVESVAPRHPMARRPVRGNAPRWLVPAPESAAWPFREPPAAL